MGQIYTNKYRIEITVDGYAYTPAAWRVPVHGRPSEVALRDYVATFERSTQPGGSNQHLGVQQVREAKIVRQHDDEVMAYYPARPLQLGLRRIS